MPYPKNSTAHYQNFGGVNEKASEYTTQNSQALKLRNIDFYVPNAWSKTPGSTQAVTNGTSGAIRSLFELETLNGQTFLLAGSNSEILRAVFPTGWTSISSSWTTGQPEDMLAFVNKGWIASGQKFISYNGSSAIPVGMTGQSRQIADNYGSLVSISFCTVFGVTHETFAGATVGNRAILTALYANIRSDGYLSPIDDRNVGPVGVTPYYTGGGSWGGVTSGNFGNNVTIAITGFTAPANQGIVGHALFLALDTFVGTSATLGKVNTGGGNFFYSPRFNDTADLSKFYLYATFAAGVTTAYISGETVSWNELTATMASFSLMSKNFFASYIPKYIELNNNQMFMSGFSAAPSTVWFSETGEPEVVEPTSFFEVRTNDGDKITGTKQFQGQLLIFKKNSFHKLVGTQESNYQLVELSTEYGCLSNKAIVEFNNKLMFLDKEGIVEYNGADWNIISTPVEDTFRTMNITAALEKAVGVHYIERNQVWFGIPVNGSTVNNLTVVYDYLLNAWTFIEGFNPASMTLAAPGSTGKRTVWYGDYSGAIFYMSPSFFSYNGTAFTSIIETGFDSPDGPDTTNMFRRLFLDVNTASGVTGKIDVSVFKDYDRTTIQATFPVYQSAFQTRAEFGVMAKSAAFRFAHANVSLPLQINGYDVQRRFLRKV